MVDLKATGKTMLRRIGGHTRLLVASLAAVAALAMTASSPSVGSAPASTTALAVSALPRSAAGRVQRHYDLLLDRNWFGRFGDCVQLNTTCTINDLVGTLDQLPGGTALSTTLTFTNAGNHNATVASMVTGACTQATASDANAYVGADTTFCNKAA